MITYYSQGTLHILFLNVHNNWVGIIGILQRKQLRYRNKLTLKIYTQVHLKTTCHLCSYVLPSGETGGGDKESKAVGE